MTVATKPEPKEKEKDREIDPSQLSPAGLIAILPPEKRKQFYKALEEEIGKEGFARLEYDWSFWARPNQREPEGDWWTHHLILAGRGFGKTRCGAEFIKNKVMTGQAKRPRLIARTSADIRNTMVFGESGILEISPPEWRPVFKERGELHWPNGVVGLCYSAEEPDRLRGPQCDVWWCDEAASWGSTQGRPNARLQQRTWDMHMFGARLGDRPHGIVTTTPTDTPLIRDLLAEVGKSVALSRGSSHENEPNLPKKFWDTIIAPYEGTAFGRQEIYAEVIDLAGAGFIHADWVRQAIKLEILKGRPKEFVAALPLDLGLDVGRAKGGDATVLIGAKDAGPLGKAIVVMEREQGQDLMSTVGQANEAIIENKARSIRIDDTGVGGGVTDRLFELQAEPGANRYLKACEIIPFNFGQRATDPERFFDVRSEMWWNCGELLRTGKLQIPDDEKLKYELTKPAMMKSSRGALKLESKESLRKRKRDDDDGSPDSADALCLAVYPDDWLGGSGGW